MVHAKKTGEVIEYFTRAEADRKSLAYIPWREATCEGQWLLTDDDHVVKCIRVKFIVELQKGGVTPRTRRKIFTGLCKKYPHGRAPMNLIEHIKAKNYGLLPTPWFVDFDKRYPAIRSMLLKLVIAGQLHMRENRHMNYNEYAEVIKIAKKIFDGPRLNAYAIKTFFGREEVRQMIRDDINKIAKDRGITVEKVFDIIQEAENAGRSKKDGKVLLAVAKEYAAIVGMADILKSGTNPGKNLPPHPDEDDAAFDKIIDANTQKAEVVV